MTQPIAVEICGSSVPRVEDNIGKTNQDCACVVYPLREDADAALFIVLDGHGELGHVVSNALLWALYERISACAWNTATLSDAQLEAQMVDAFEGAHEHVKTADVDAATGKVPADESGAVGVALLLRRGRMILAHAGDSRAIMGTLGDGGEVQVVELTHDHKLEDPGERARIEATGAWIKPQQEQPYFVPARVYKDEKARHKGPGLTMSRSLGDVDADACGVIPTPEVSFRPINRTRDRFVVLASDGVWEFLSNEQVAEIVEGFRNDGQPAIIATRFLVAKAAMAWAVEEGTYRDDITATVIYLDDLPDNLAG